MPTHTQTACECVEWEQDAAVQQLSLWLTYTHNTARAAAQVLLTGQPDSVGVWKSTCSVWLLLINIMISYKM